MKRFTILSLVAMIFTGCIKNDIPYPKIVAEVTSFEASGQKSAANINVADRTVVVDMADTADLCLCVDVGL
jgi:hypothetical protein